MELNFREVMTWMHGMFFGGFFLMSIFGLLVLLVRRPAPGSDREPYASVRQSAYLLATVFLGWAAVLSGAYVVYPWYRAVPPSGAKLALYPQRLLIASPSTAGWHYLGMEWKEHVAWFAPMAITMVAFVMLRHRAAWSSNTQIRRAILGYAAAALFAGLLAGGWGAMIDKAAPVEGGRIVSFMEGNR
ncbi:MAG TPA: hypothetical protein VJU82_13085 [Acidobacteriaceae bacterium]|nr:hypothetical protein [Acidobacteriaceae bacterium]